MRQVLLGYVVTQNLLVPFQRTLSFQRQFSDCLSDADAVLVSDIPAEDLGLTNIVAPALNWGENTCLAAQFNIILDHAVEKGFEWVLLLDADTVLISPPNDFPPTGCACVNTWLLHPDETPAARGISYSRAASWRILLGRDVFLKHRFREDYQGHFNVHLDFLENTLATAGIVPSPTDAHIVHLWHPPRFVRGMINNSALFSSRPKGKAIALIAHNRPHYLRTVLKALSQAKGIEEYKLFCGIDPGSSEVLQLCETIDFTETELVVNKVRFGINYNNRNTIQHAFGKGYGFVVVVEDDIVLSSDALSLCSWFWDWEHRDGFLLMNLFASESSAINPLLIESRRHFCPWGWCITKEKYQRWVRPAWMRDGRGWDFSIQRIFEQHRALRALMPSMSRVHNIGREGVNWKPEHHDSVFAKAIRSDGSYGNKFEFHLQPVSRWEDVHERIDEIDGWLVSDHASWLFETARSTPPGSKILEIGPYQGRSTAALAFGCVGSDRQVYCVDTWAGTPTEDFVWEYYAVWKTHMTSNFLLPHVVPLEGLSAVVLRQLMASGTRFNLSFIDGGHDFETARRDFELVYELTMPGGYIAMHDVHFTWPGRERAWKTIAETMLVDCGFIDGLAFGKRPML